MRIFILFLALISPYVFSEESIWVIDNNKPDPERVFGFPDDMNFDNGFLIPSINMLPVKYGDYLRITLKVTEWFGVKPAQKCIGTKVGEPIDKGMGLHKFNSVWIKMDQICTAYKREDNQDVIDYYMILFPQTYGDVIKIINVFKISNEVIYDNKYKFTAKGFNKTFDIYSKRLGL